MMRFAVRLGVAAVLMSAAVWMEAQDGLLATAVPHRYLVAYGDGAVLMDAGARVRSAGGVVLQTYAHAGVSVVLMQGGGSRDVEMERLKAQANVVSVTPDLVLPTHVLAVRRASANDVPGAPPSSFQPVLVNDPNRTVPDPPKARFQPVGVNGSAAVATEDVWYAGAAGWAVRQSGGYGAGVGGSVVAGPWSVTKGEGVRIAVLDSGVDGNHPDLAGRVVLNLSEIDKSAMPSVCDDGSAMDQTGHGTWAASLAAAGVGASTGKLAGVAPAASILNIKVLQRMPGDGTTDYERCRSGQAQGLLSWLIQGIEDAVANHADVINLSLGGMIDLYTGDGAGAKAMMDQATHAAANAGVVVVAALGNDGFDFANTRYAEIPAMARDVLAVVASTNAACMENLIAGATCATGGVTLPYYSNRGLNVNAVAAPGGSYPRARMA